MLGYGSLGAAMFYMIIGNFGLHLEITETLAVSSILANDGGPPLSWPFLINYPSLQ